MHTLEKCALPARVLDEKCCAQRLKFSEMKMRNVRAVKTPLAKLHYTGAKDCGIFTIKRVVNFPNPIYSRHVKCSKKEQSVCVHAFLLYGVISFVRVRVRVVVSKMCGGIAICLRT